jgi:hypothetical protein
MGNLGSQSISFQLQRSFVGRKFLHLVLQRGLVGSGLSGDPCLPDGQQSKESRKVIKQRIQGRQKT